eukprot:CAMPEP_0178955138 /NCGR_PEP_ID=MMETSP0789-20121207/9421_1 /TAXON_ID=3005 /ORGANISM="Rhizosolenia setigera, Strain CCMP 1694" /LENGTH=137 /DNA_ID=CAMNT_0020636701 /DNA_START=81 /DNA_END=494 /DNA_ORIENTATION=+
MKKAGKTVMDSGNKAMLKTDVMFLEKEIKGRKQRFGVEVYELMERLEVDTELSVEEKENKIRLAFDRARKDIAVIQAKIECKKEEVTQIEAKSKNSQSSSDNLNNVPPNSGSVGAVLTTGHPSDMMDDSDKQDTTSI